MAKSKKNRQRDFQKVKLKVGRKLKKGDNITNASFKTRTVQVTQRLKSGQVTEPSTHRKQKIGELLSQCSHYNNSVRHGAVTGLRELVINFPDIIDQNSAAILEKSSGLFTDKDATVRQGVIRLLKSYLPRVTEKQISPFFPLICAHLCCAMTHIYDEVQIDSLLVLDILLETFPQLMVSKSSQVLTNFIDQISRKKGQGQESGSRSLTVNPNSRLSSIKWRTSVLSRLEKFLLAIVAYNKEKAGPDIVAINKLASETKWSHDKAVGVEFYPQSCHRSWETPGFTLSVSGFADQGSENFKSFVITLVPLLIECWIESMPAKQPSGDAGSLLHPDSVGTLSSILSVTQLLWESAAFHKNEAQETLGDGTYLKDFQHHFMASFPYAVQERPANKDKSEKTDKNSAEYINLAICDILTQLLASQSSSVVPEWVEDIVTYLRDFLHGIYGSKMLGQSSKIIVKVLKRFMILRLDEEILQELLLSTLERFKRAHDHSTEKTFYLKFFSDVCLSDDKAQCLSEEIRIDFLSTLPELLTHVGRGNPEISAMLITTMKRAACQNCSNFLDLISRQCHAWFGLEPSDKEADISKKDTGQFLQMDSSLRQEMISLIYFLPSMDSKLYENLFLLTRKLDIAESEIDYMLQVLHNRYLHYAEDQDQAVLYLGFLGTLILGHHKREDNIISYSEGFRNLGYHYVHDTQDEHSSRDKWNRHVFIVQRICMLLQLFDNVDQIITVMEFFLSQYCQRQVLGTRLAYGICRFAESFSVSSNIISHIKELSFSVLHESVRSENGFPPELLEVAVDLVLKIPGASQELFGRILKEDQDVSCLRVCLLFLTEKRRHDLKVMTGCCSALRNIIKYYKDGISQGTQIKVVDPIHLKVLTEMEYLVETL